MMRHSWVTFCARNARRRASRRRSRDPVGCPAATAPPFSASMTPSIETAIFTRSDYQVGEARDGFDAVGCGSEAARGALFATRNLKPEARVRLSLRAAERCNAGVQGPFLVLST